MMASATAQCRRSAPRYKLAAGAATPEFRGESLRGAFAIARAHGVQIETSGEGYVVAQNPPSGTPLRGGAVQLTLAENGAMAPPVRGRADAGRSVRSHHRRRRTAHSERTLAERAMKLGELIAGVAVKRVAGSIEDEITGLGYDSRKVKPGDLFFSTARDEQQNRANLEDAFKRGARAAVVRGWDGEAARSAFTLIECEQPAGGDGTWRRRASSARPAGDVDLIGVTGTSGKTTTTYLLASIFEAAGISSGIIGTIGIFAGGRKLYSGLTTPESIDFEGALAGMDRDGVRSVAAEISSIGLDQRRVDELSFRACVFTNLGPRPSRLSRDYRKLLRSQAEALHRDTPPQYPSRRGRGRARRRSVRTARASSAVGGRKLSFGFDRALDVHPESFTRGHRRYPRDDQCGRAHL